VYWFMEHIAVGLVEGAKVIGALNIYPQKSQTLDPLQSMPAESIVECIRRQVEKSRTEQRSRRSGSASRASSVLESWRILPTCTK